MKRCHYSRDLYLNRSFYPKLPYLGPSWVPIVAGPEALFTLFTFIGDSVKSPIGKRRANKGAFIYAQKCSFYLFVVESGHYLGPFWTFMSDHGSLYTSLFGGIWGAILGKPLNQGISRVCVLHQNRQFRTTLCIFLLVENV